MATLPVFVRRANESFNPVEAAVATFGDDVAASLTAKSAPFVPENGSVDFRLLMDVEVSMANSARLVVVDKGSTFSNTTAEKTKVGLEYRGSVRELTKGMRRFRSALAEHHGREILGAIGLAGPFRALQNEAIAEVEHVIELYEKVDRSLYPKLPAAGELDDGARISWLRDQVKVCRDKKQDYALAVKKNDGAREELKVAYEEFRLVFVNATEVIESLFRMAGFREQADRLRRLVRKASRGGRSQEPSEEPAPSGEAASESPPHGTSTVSGPSLPVDATDIVEIT